MAGVGGASGAAGVGAATGAVAGSGAAAAAAGPRGVTAGTWVSVKVGFVRSLEDELRKSLSDDLLTPVHTRGDLAQWLMIYVLVLAVTPEQKLYLHEVYDDGWSLCEDEEHKKGVVPVNCLQSLH